MFAAEHEVTTIDLTRDEALRNDDESPGQKWRRGDDAGARTEAPYATTSKGYWGAVIDLTCSELDTNPPPSERERRKRKWNRCAEGSRRQDWGNSQPRDTRVPLSGYMIPVSPAGDESVPPWYPLWKVGDEIQLLGGTTRRVERHMHCLTGCADNTLARIPARLVPVARALVAQIVLGRGHFTDPVLGYWNRRRHSHLVLRDYREPEMGLHEMGLLCIYSFLCCGCAPVVTVRGYGGTQTAPQLAISLNAQLSNSSVANSYSTMDTLQHICSALPFSMSMMDRTYFAMQASTAPTNKQMAVRSADDRSAWEIPVVLQSEKMISQVDSYMAKLEEQYGTLCGAEHQERGRMTLIQDEHGRHMGGEFSAPALAVEQARSKGMYDISMSSSDGPGASVGEYSRLYQRLQAIDCSRTDAQADLDRTFTDSELCLLMRINDLQILAKPKHVKVPAVLSLLREGRLKEPRYREAATTMYLYPIRSLQLRFGHPWCTSPLHKEFELKVDQPHQVEDQDIAHEGPQIASVAHHEASIAGGSDIEDKQSSTLHDIWTGADATAEAQVIRGFLACVFAGLDGSTKDVVGFHNSVSRADCVALWAQHGFTDEAEAEAKFSSPCGGLSWPLHISSSCGSRFGIHSKWFQVHTIDARLTLDNLVRI